jgi:hypothetical protein
MQRERSVWLLHVYSSGYLYKSEKLVGENTKRYDKVNFDNLSEGVTIRVI